MFAFVHMLARARMRFYAWAAPYLNSVGFEHLAQLGAQRLGVCIRSELGERSCAHVGGGDAGGDFGDLWIEASAAEIGDASWRRRRRRRRQWVCA